MCTAVKFKLFFLAVTLCHLMNISFKNDMLCVLSTFMDEKDDTWCYVSINRNGAVTYPDCALYEVGGNIGKWKCLRRFLSADICMSFCSLS